MLSDKVFKYNLESFDNIKKNLNVKISKSVLDKIENITNEITNFNKNNQNKHISKENWNNNKNFKVTKFIKKEGFEKKLNIIRINLNKITNKNYEVLSSIIFNEINNIDKNNINDFLNIKQLIIETASNINIYSEIYVRLFKYLLDVYDKKIFDVSNNFNIFKNEIINIKITDSVHVNYDDYCSNKKSCEQKKNLCLFYVNMMKQDILCKTDIIDLILIIQEYNFEMTNDINKNNIIDILCEFIYILVKNSFDYIKDKDKYEKIYNNILKIKKLKKDNNNSLTSKSKFKHMDILDLISL